MELEGTLKATSLPELLQFLSSGKKSGILTVKSSDKQISLMIQDGKIVNSSSMDRPRKLGEMLVNRGFIRRSELEQVLAQQKSSATEKLLGELLMENNLVSPEILKEAIRLQLEEEIWELLSWKEGTFQFRQTKDKHFSNILVELDIEPFLLEGSRRLDEWSKIAKNIENEQLVVAINPINIEEFEREIALSESEWQVLALINGFYNVGSIVARSGLSKFETFQVLSSFLLADLIRIKEPHEVSPPATQEEEQSPPEISEPGKLKESAGTSTTRKPPIATLPLKLFQLRRTATAEKPAELLNFISPISLICYFLNSFFQQLLEEPEFITSPNDKQLISLLWQETLMSYPRADLIRIRDRQLDPRDLDYLINILGISSEIIFSCYEDSLTALKELGTKLWRITVLRLGEKNTRKILNSILEDMEGRIVLEHGKDFNLREFIQKLAI